MLNSIAPPGTLGRISGIGAAQWAAFASVAPTLWGSVFAFGVDKRVIRGHLVYVVLLAYASGYNVFLQKKGQVLVSAAQH
jgi:hypothetical protein